MPEPDDRPALPAFDTSPVLPGDRFIRLWRSGDKVIYLRERTRRAPKCCPAFAWNAMAETFITATKPRKPKSHTPIKSVEAIGAAGLRRDANRAWARKPKVFRRAFDRWDAPEPGWALKRQAETAELVDAFFAAGGSMSFYHTHREGKPTVDNRRIDLRCDGHNTWRVELVEDDVAGTVGYFSDFDQAQRFALAAARLWRTELCTEKAA